MMKLLFPDFVLRKDEGILYKTLYNPILEEILCFLLLMPWTCKTQQYYYRLLIRFLLEGSKKFSPVNSCRESVLC